MLPVLYLFLFGPLLEGATQAAGAGTNAFNWFVPGLLIQIAIFGTAFVGFGLIAELRSGVIERMRVTPMSRGAMLLGRSLRDVVILMLQAILLIVLAVPLGLAVDLPGIAVVLALLVLIGLAVAPISYAAALTLKSEDSFAPLVQGIAMPLLLLSGILLPMALAPAWLQTLSSAEPVHAYRGRCAGLVQRPVGRSGDRDRRGHHCGHGRHLRVGRGPDVQPRQRVADGSREPHGAVGSRAHRPVVSGRRCRPAFSGTSGGPRPACTGAARTRTTSASTDTSDSHIRSLPSEWLPADVAGQIRLDPRGCPSGTQIQSRPSGAMSASCSGFDDRRQIGRRPDEDLTIQSSVPVERIVAWASHIHRRAEPVQIASRRPDHRGSHPASA